MLCFASLLGGANILTRILMGYRLDMLPKQTVPVVFHLAHFHSELGAHRRRCRAGLKQVQRSRGAGDIALREKVVRGLGMVTYRL